MKSFLLLFFLIPFFCFSQNKKTKPNKLETGNTIPFKRVSVFNTLNEKTNLDLPNKNSMGDKYVAVFIYSLKSKSTKELIALNAEIEQVLNKYQNNACKGANEIEYATICLEKDFNKWQDFLLETKSKTKFTGKKTNYLAKDELNDDVVKAFKVTENPIIFIVNPLGRLRIETSDPDRIEAEFSSICRVNASSSTANISGKLLIGEKNKLPLTEHKVYLVKSDVDTIKTTSTDGYGDFSFKQIDTTQQLSIRIQENEKIKDVKKVYLAKQTGEVMSEFKRNPRSGGFEYKLLKVEIVKLTEIDDFDDDITFKYKKFNASNDKNLTVNESVYYELAKYNILTESEIILDKVLVILNANPDVKLQVISHTDSQGEDAANLVLSTKRSESVINYLVSRGIQSTRLKALGKGETEIRNRCTNGFNCSDKEHEYNRRTEFKFIKE